MYNTYLNHNDCTGRFTTKPKHRSLLPDLMSCPTGGILSPLEAKTASYTNLEQVDPVNSDVYRHNFFETSKDPTLTCLDLFKGRNKERNMSSVCP